MSEFKFACPTCGQHIAGDAAWAGAQIKCPACQADMTVPQPPAAAAPPPPPPVVAPTLAPAMRLAMASAPATHASQPAPPPPVSRPAGPAVPMPQVPPNFLQPKKSPGKGRTILTVAAIVVGVAVAFALALPYINKAQDKLEEARKKDAEESGGGQVGHIAELKNVLDATDPTRFERGGPTYKTALPPPPHTLDVTKATIPTGEMRGNVINSSWVLSDASIEVNGAAYVLTFYQQLPMREIVVSLRLNPGENIQGKSWTISSDMTTGVPGIGRRWRNDQTSPVARSGIASGYAMKLEFGKASSGVIDGKIYLALPDPEKTVLAGEFQADIRLASAPGAPRARRGVTGD